jgi:hypothetical protein
MATSSPYGSRWSDYDYKGKNGDTYNSRLNNEPDKNKNNNGGKVTQTTVVGVTSSIFRIFCTGLKPNTLHKPYLVNFLVTADCAPLVDDGLYNSSYAYGQPLITNQYGILAFDYRFKPENSPFETYTIKSGTSKGTVIAIIPFSSQPFKVTSADGNSYAQSFIECKQPT